MAQKGKGKIVINSDIYEGGNIYIGPRDLDSGSQGTYSFGLEDSTIVKATFTVTTVRSRGSAEKVKGGGVKKEGVTKQGVDPGGT